MKWLKKLARQWRCRNGHLAPSVTGLEKDHPYESQTVWYRMWECLYCGEKWGQRISNVEASRKSGI